MLCNSVPPREYFSRVETPNNKLAHYLYSPEFCIKYQDISIENKNQQESISAKQSHF